MTRTAAGAPRERLAKWGPLTRSGLMLLAGATRAMPPGNPGQGPRLDGRDATLFISSRRSDGASRTGPLPRVKVTARLPEKGSARRATLPAGAGATRAAAQHKRPGARSVSVACSPQGGQIGTERCRRKKGMCQEIRTTRLHHRSNATMKQTGGHRKHIVLPGHEFAVIKKLRCVNASNLLGMPLWTSRRSHVGCCCAASRAARLCSAPFCCRRGCMPRWQDKRRRLRSRTRPPRPLVRANDRHHW